ncbi:hypothetical protein PR048_028131 [Dryococelus australis]|uniref:Uncharacterized protein n=1 Tax=Dryococelus australis TaxID=614101 RepID=A0ABQ9GIB9_9NEOP|nr:hypothetical protein PR048_028131 [Dryococelus australis]
MPIAFQSSLTSFIQLFPVKHVAFQIFFGQPAVVHPHQVPPESQPYLPDHTRNWFYGLVQLQTKIFKNYELGEKDTNDINNINSDRQDKSYTAWMTQLPQSVPELCEEEIHNSTQQRNADVTIASLSCSLICFPLTTHRSCHTLRVPPGAGKERGDVEHKLLESPHRGATKRKTEAIMQPSHSKSVHKFSLRTYVLMRGPVCDVTAYRGLSEFLVNAISSKLFHIRERSSVSILRTELVSEEVWAVLRADEDEASAGMKRVRRGEISEKTCRPATSSGTIVTRENPRATPLGIEPGSPIWEASSLTIGTPWPPPTQLPNGFSDAFSLLQFRMEHSPHVLQEEKRRKPRDRREVITGARALKYGWDEARVLTSGINRSRPVVKGGTGKKQDESPGQWDQDYCPNLHPEQRTLSASQPWRTGLDSRWDFSHVRIVPDDASGRRDFSGISRFPSPFHSGDAPYSPHFTLIGSQDLDVKSRRNIFTHFTHPGRNVREHEEGNGDAVVLWLDYSSPTSVNRVRFPVGSAPRDFSHVGIVPDDAAGRRVFSGISRFLRPCIAVLIQARLASPASAPKTSMLKATQISSLHSSNRDRSEKTQKSARLRRRSWLLLRITFRGILKLPLGRAKPTRVESTTPGDRALRSCGLEDKLHRKQAQDAAAGIKEREETGDRRGNPPTSGIYRHDTHLRKYGVVRPGIEPGSPRWEASRLTAQPPRPIYTGYGHSVKIKDQVQGYLDPRWWSWSSSSLARGKLPIGNNADSSPVDCSTLPSSKQPPVPNPLAKQVIFPPPPSTRQRGR